MVTMEQWQEAQKAERTFHTMSRKDGIDYYGDCYKQYFTWLNINPDIKSKRVVEIGCADFPALYFCTNTENASIVEPGVTEMLQSFRFKIDNRMAEDVSFEGVDEVWLLNVLQHTKDPGKIVENIKQAKCVRFFEPINYGYDACHIHNFTIDTFKEWFGDCVKHYPKNMEAQKFHQWENAYGVWLHSQH